MAFLVHLICLRQTEDWQVNCVLAVQSLSWGAFTAGRPAGTEMNGVFPAFRLMAFFYTCKTSSQIFLYSMQALSFLRSLLVKFEMNSFLFWNKKTCIGCGRFAIIMMMAFPCIHYIL
jgi:hypothetical protein